MKKTSKLYLIPAIVALAYAPFWLYLEPGSKWAFAYAGYALACFFQSLNRVFARILKKPNLTSKEIASCVMSYDGGATWVMRDAATGIFVKINADAVKSLIDSHATGQ